MLVHFPHPHPYWDVEETQKKVKHIGWYKNSLTINTSKAGAAIIIITIQNESFK